MLDVEGTSAQLDEVVRELQAALAVCRGADVKLYEHPVTHQFALIRLPKQFADGDSLSTPPSNRWFSSRQEAMAALPELFNQNEDCVSDEQG